MSFVSGSNYALSLFSSHQQLRFFVLHLKEFAASLLHTLNILQLIIIIILKSLLFIFSPAVISALKNLQDKVKKLELERTQAEQNLQTLASETEQYKDMLNHDKTSGKGKQFTFGSYMENGDGYAANQAKGKDL